MKFSKRLDEKLSEFQPKLNLPKAGSTVMAVLEDRKVQAYYVETVNESRIMVLPIVKDGGFTEVDASKFNRWEYLVEFTEPTAKPGEKNENSHVQSDEEKPEGDSNIGNIDVSTVTRTPLLNAIKDSGHTLTSLAKAVGVDTPMISRLLRLPKDTAGDPGGRNPSIQLAGDLCRVLRMDPASAFPDIFRQGGAGSSRRHTAPVSEDLGGAGLTSGQPITSTDYDSRLMSRASARPDAATGDVDPVTGMPTDGPIDPDHAKLPDDMDDLSKEFDQVNQLGDKADDHMGNISKDIEAIVKVLDGQNAR